jgi:hypothetical protein
VGGAADWVAALGVIALVMIVSIVTRWRQGRRRRFRLTVVLERDFEGPETTGENNDG